jgi:hypothetical protein
VEHEANRAYARRNEEILRGANVHLEREAERRGKPDSALALVLCECAEACGGSVSIPTSERLFGQGVRATFDKFTATTTTP